MTPELVRLLIIILLCVALAYSIIVLVLFMVFGAPNRVPPPPLPPRNG